MDCGVPSTEVAAARVVLDQSLEATELDDVMERLEELERRAGKEV